MLGAIALVPGANFSYISGLHFHLMERPTLLFMTADNQILVFFGQFIYLFFFGTSLSLMSPVVTPLSLSA